MKIGMVGLGKMGGNMVERLRRGGHDVVGFDAFSDATEVASLDALVDALGDSPRTVWSMVPSGDPTEETVTALIGLLGAGDLIVEGGNSNWRDSRRRAEVAAAQEIGYIDAGVSGGVWGLDNGYALMVGGTDEHVARAQPIFDTLSPDEGGFSHAGESGAGHFTKMVHNGVEYAIMQAYAEGYELLSKVDIDLDVLGGMKSWQHGSVVRSWLLDLLVKALDERPGLEGIAPYVPDSGEGRWTVEEAVTYGVPANTIAAALFARFTSQDDDSPAMKALAAMRNQFGGHAIKEES
jgi:6-phosphogluconate dehydrogenase